MHRSARYMKRRHVPTTITLNWKPRFKSLCSICWVMVSKPTYEFALISSAVGAAIVCGSEGEGVVSNGREAGRESLAVGKSSDECQAREIHPA